MAKRVNRVHVPGYLFFEARLEPNEVLIIPVTRSVSQQGDTAMSFMATAGTKISYTIEHHEVLNSFVSPYQFISSAGDLTTPNNPNGAFANPSSIARVWNADYVVGADDIYELHRHVTAIRITAPAAGGFVVVYGDY